MIKINLLPQKRAKRSQASEPGTRDFMVGVIAVLGAAAVVYFVFDRPKRNEIAEFRNSSKDLNTQIQTSNAQLVGYDTMKAAKDEANTRIQAINHLNGTTVVPANILHELGRVLTSKGPTMTQMMIGLTGNGGDSNKMFQSDWDPTHVWITAFTDKAGLVTIEGGAQSESDVTQLSKRLAASAYFIDVAPSAEERASDKDSGLNYFKFTITGKVAY
jgi:Tfp pilus assembly protein PilN